jgi:NAD(P)-dependent dehydrogenase (short-subunit alcohol dehydrogenase family)
MSDSTHTPTAVVTGGSQGLGLALVRALHQHGWNVVVDARRVDRLAAAVRELRADGSPAAVVGIPGDVTDADHRRDLAKAARELGAVRAVVNNASTLGASPLPALDRIDPDTLRHVFDVNVVAPIALVQELAPELGEHSAVVNITSDAAVEPYETWGGYGASKAALEHASRILAVEHPEWRVLVVDPGDMRTEMHQDAFPGEDISDRPEPDASVPGLVTLITGDRPSGRYQAREPQAHGASDADDTGRRGDSINTEVA